ncbi:MAG: patatin-like phospholipase family protein [Promethearchaeota archaeon]
MVGHKIIRNLLGKNSRVGLALGSGGAAGFAHIGVIKVLIENDIPIDFVAGSSAGAIVGAYYSLYKEVNSLEKLIIGMTKRQIISLFGLNSWRRSLISNDKFKKFLLEIFENKSFSDLKIPLAVTAVDLETSEEVVFRKGSLIDAIMASISVPGIFPIRRVNKKLLVDGGVLNPLPINIVKDMGADIVIGVDLSYPDNIKLSSFNPLIILGRTIDILMKQSMKLRNHNLKNTFIIRPEFHGNLHSFHIFNAKEYIKIGEKAARKRLPEIKKLVNRKCR